MQRNSRACPCQNNSNNTSNDNNENMIEEMSMCSNMCKMPNNDCQCGFDMNEDQKFPSNPMYAQSYVPIQKLNKVFTPEMGLKMGTIFPELVSPYSPCQSIREIEYLKNNNEIGEGCNG